MTAFKFTHEYRESDEYKQWVAEIKKDYPNMPLYLIELAIHAHKNDPLAYKKDKNAKIIMKTPPKVTVNKDQTVVNDAIKVNDKTTIQFFDTPKVLGF